MRLGLGLGYWGSGPAPNVPDQVRLAEDLGFDSVWTAEAYGSDALTPLAWLGASTTRVRLGTSVIQMSARTPTATAMAAMTLDHLSGGRVVLGIGVSGPQVVEGWYGQPFPKPLARTREYVEVLRKAFAREVVSLAGEHYSFPYAGGTGLGKPLRSTLHPVRSDIPVLLGAEGPRNVALAAEIADGWIPLFLSPYADEDYRAALAEGFARPGARHTLDDFEIASMVRVEIGDDVEECADRIRPMLALYIGGMGAKGANFHNDVFVRMGYAAEAERIQELYLAGRKAEAVAAVPLELVEQTSLIGPKDKIRAELPAWEGSLVTTMLIGGSDETLRVMAELLG